jgi:hypothetical protein
MKVLITDLTRMYNGHVCAAGIELKSGKRVRPVLRGPLTTKMLSVWGGPFDIGNEIDLGRTHWCGDAPEVEDALFLPGAAKAKRQMTGPEFFSTLSSHLSSGLERIGPELVREGQSLVTQSGRGRCSLVMTSAKGSVAVSTLPRPDEDGMVRNKVRYLRDDGIELSVTDVRLYKRDMITPDEERVRWLQARLAEQPEVILCFGLGRPFNGRHYLQLNNLHLSNAPDWRVASA